MIAEDFTARRRQIPKQIGSVAHHVPSHFGNVSDTRAGGFDRSTKVGESLSSLTDYVTWRNNIAVTVNSHLARDVNSRQRVGLVDLRWLIRRMCTDSVRMTARGGRWIARSARRILTLRSHRTVGAPSLRQREPGLQCRLWVNSGAG